MMELVIVTGASSNHFRALRNLLYSISKFEPNTPTIVYDLGLNINERETLKKGKYDLIQFEYEKYPPYFNIQIESGQYAWKPVIISDVMNRMNVPVLWLDAGNLIQNRVDRIRHILANEGFYSPTSTGTIRQWTHPGTLAYLNAPTTLLSKANRNGAIVGLAPARPGIAELVERWKQCALDIACIAPCGSNRSNHRQDQAVLSVLAYQFQDKYRYKLEDRRFDITIHNDEVSPMVARILLNLPLPIRHFLFTLCRKWIIYTRRKRQSRRSKLNES